MSEFRPDPIDRMTGKIDQTALPPGIAERGEGAKFTPDGEIQIWPGNTMLCHIPQDGEAHRALCAIKAGLAAGPHAAHFRFMPDESLHMTVFQGISGLFANQFDWPEGIDKSATRNQVTRALLDRLDGIDLPATRRVRALNVFAGHSMTMDGVGADEEGLRDTRRALQAATGISPASFERYTFHVTLAYQIKWLDAAAAHEVQNLSDALFAKHGAALQDITLGRVEFCNFEHMDHFEPLRYL